ncbi:MAG: VCBS repeat-containing protein [Desulfuromonadaceae bacterium]|nr:VCBS repeat-containing protein [Desulfuromonadaceae bacterium]MDD5106580.1 VCBS repeat-containing protein [Desulfuromonadaceae bacterium]
MKHILPVLLALFMFSFFSGTSHAALLKIHVAAFTVTGASNSDELKLTLQGILTSRLDPELIQLVEKPDQAEILITGNYAQFGNMFSLDARIKTKRDGSLTTVFEQGETQADVIPAMGRLAQKIDAKLLQNQALVKLPSNTTTALPSGTQDTCVILSGQSTKSGPDSWSSAPLAGVPNSIATGLTRSSGERELFIASENAIRAYLKGNNLRLIAETIIPAPAKILALDSADLDKDGTLELYVTITTSGIPASRVYRLDGSGFKSEAENLPWFFRGIGSDFASRTIYAQELQADGKFYGDVKKIALSEGTLTTTGSLKLPRAGNIFNFNQLTDAAGKQHYVVLNEDRYLVVYSFDGNEEWRSSDKFGGSESFFSHESHEHIRSSRDSVSRTFLEQRISMIKDGTVFVPANESSLSFGTIRNYNKYSLFAFEWTGTVLKEKWRSRPASGYLADYVFDQAAGEVLLLERVKSPGLFADGVTVLTISSID